MPDLFEPRFGPPPSTGHPVIYHVAFHLPALDLLRRASPVADPILDQIRIQKRHVLADQGHRLFELAMLARRCILYRQRRFPLLHMPNPLSRSPAACPARAFVPDSRRLAKRRA